METGMDTDVLIAGTGCSGLYAALNLPSDKKILMITKSDVESNDSMLAQGGICMLKSKKDYDSYFEDTLKAGHYENDCGSVEIMIKSSRDIIHDLVNIGVEFTRNPDGTFAFTREGAHSHHRILYHEDITGKEITSKLLEAVRKLSNVTIMEYTTLLDIIENDGKCVGGVIRLKDGTVTTVRADVTILATGGIGGLFDHSTNYHHLTGDGVAISLKHGVELKDVDYIQIHPTTFYSKDPEERSFLISESVRGEGAKLLDKNHERFTNELLPRDLLTAEINKQMKKDDTKFVWEDMRTIPDEERNRHFPNIVEHSLENGYDPAKTPIPVCPAQHYFMGGIKVNYDSKTSMDGLYAVGETACNGVHGKNRLASNSLLESMVFAKRAAKDISSDYFEGKLVKAGPSVIEGIDLAPYKDGEKLAADYKEMVLNEIDEEKNARKIEEKEAV